MVVPLAARPFEKHLAEIAGGQLFRRDQPVGCAHVTPHNLDVA